MWMKRVSQSLKLTDLLNRRIESRLGFIRVNSKNSRPRWYFRKIDSSERGIIKDKDMWEKGKSERQLFQNDDHYISEKNMENIIRE